MVSIDVKTSITSRGGLLLTIALQMKQITKKFAGVTALDHVSLSVKEGEIHALCGENGAGKSTLMKVLSGLYPFGTYEGDIYIRENKQCFRSIKDAEHAGIAIIYQELALVKQMTLAENLFIGNERAKSGIIDTTQSYHDAQKWLSTVGLGKLHPEQTVEDLGIGEQQLVEIAKALAKDASILILDEPTAALTEKESRILLNILGQLKKRGVSSIYISHKLSEVTSIADTVTVLRDGKTVTTCPIAHTTEPEIIHHMVGRELDQRFPKIKIPAQDVVLKIRHLSVWRQKKQLLHDLSFQVHRGEILGIAGLMGSGRSELALHLFGAHNGKQTGQVLFNGQVVQFKHPAEAIRAGLALVTEDRKKTGLILNQSILKNLSLAHLAHLAKWQWIDENREIQESYSFIEKLKIKSRTFEDPVATLSGGNQQKVVLGKWMMTQPQVLILDEPTRGVDVGAKYELYQQMNQLVKEGIAIIMISSELPEIIGMSDRIMVMAEGRKMAEFETDEATPERIMQAATGGKVS
ncbi:ATP-binding cassette domain-containing protein [Hazenella sp. IB182357]|uniref:ATP-binding cassette domain-containing protein n=2 Tax=Polycladospora coralii TaxID=2771432 RepID=A0A926RU43_9BACL|nr:ATP-binding cassette domain-containing protein [Polycladospora coralii]